MFYDLLGFVLLGALALGAAAAAAGRSWIPLKLLLLAVALRIVGSLVRYEVLFRFYRGLGDAVRYYHEGLDLMRRFWGAGESVVSAAYWLPEAGQWWGTPFLIRVSGAVLALIGPTMRGEFLVFSLLSFLGLYAIAAAFHNTGVGLRRSLLFAGLIFLWPSLWYWPSSVGKEAVLMLAIGLVTLGYVGRDEAIRWVPFAAGLGLAFCVRPHVAAVLALAAMAAQWLAGWQRLTPRRLLESVAAVVLVIVALNGMRAQFGLEDADLEGVVEFVEFRAGQTVAGGSKIARVPLGPAGALLAPVNVWLRPFPWEAHNLTSLIAAGELVILWVLVWRWRRGVRFTLRNWRHHRMLRFAVPLLVAYTLMIGLTFANLGIIARQRSPMFPFMLVLVVAAPQRATEADRQAPGRFPAAARRAA